MFETNFKPGSYVLKDPGTKGLIPMIVDDSGEAILQKNYGGITNVRVGGSLELYMEQFKVVLLRTGDCPTVHEAQDMFELWKRDPTFDPKQEEGMAEWGEYLDNLIAEYKTKYPEAVNITLSKRAQEFGITVENYLAIMKLVRPSSQAIQYMAIEVEALHQSMTEAENRIAELEKKLAKKESTK